MMDYEASLSPSENSTFLNVSNTCQFYSNSSTWLWELIDDKLCWKHSSPITFLFIVLYSFIFICGWIGNSLVIWVVLCKPKMRTVTNLFLLNLAVADLFVIIFCVPVTLLTNIFNRKPNKMNLSNNLEEKEFCKTGILISMFTALFLNIAWVLGDFMCKAVPYIQGVSVFSSAYSLVAVSVDRCWAIHHPMGLPRGLSKPQALVFILVIWISAIAITLPWWFVFQLVSLPGPLPFCHEAWSNPTSDRIYFLSVHFLVCFTIPILLIIILNGIVWRNVTSRPIIPHSSSASTTLSSVHLLHRTTKVRVLKMLSILTLAFFFSWLPLYVVMTRLKFFGLPNKIKSPVGHYFFQVLIPIAQLLGSANSCLNPILYAFLNRKFRTNLNSLVATCFSRFSKERPSQGQIPLVCLNNIVGGKAQRAVNGKHQVVVHTTRKITRGNMNTSSFYSTNTFQTHTECICTNL